MLLRLLLFAAYGNTRKEQVESISSSLKMRRLQCAKLSTRFPVEVRTYRLQESKDRMHIWDINGTRTKRIYRRI